MKENTKVEKNSGQFQKGHAKIGGRQKGTPNKRTADIIERLKEEDIVGSLLEIAQRTEKEETQVTIYKELLKYIYPQRKAVDMSLENKLPTTVYINREPVYIEEKQTIA